MRRIFVEYAADKRCALRTKDEQYKAQVPWSGYEADHVLPHTYGGRTVIENGQVLRRHYNHKQVASLEFAF